MNKFRFTINVLAIAIFMLAFASFAQAQATRTWVSGVGDDVNPCSRTAPCKTFAGAVSKTAVNGEIDCLDPGGFGALTINKGITVDGTTGSGFGSILATSVNGIIVNDAGGTANDQGKIVIRNLSINGTAGSNASTFGGLNGIRILQTAFQTNVSIENCRILGFTGNPGQGIRDERTLAGSTLTVTDCFISGSASHGIAFVGGAIKASIVRTTTSNNGGGGVVVTAGARVSIVNSVAAGNVNNAGYFVQDASLLDLEGCVSSNNATGLQTVAGSTTRISNVNLSQNTTGLNNGGTTRSFGNNKIDSNNTNTSGNAILGPGTGGPQPQ